MTGQTLTVLFTDVVESTALAARLGPDGAEQLRRTITTDLTTAVDRAGGQVVKGLGDGIMAAFESVRGALDAAVGMQQAVEARNRSAAEPVGLRVGLASGEVTREGDDLHGPTVVAAARLCAAASAGQIIAADVVRLLAGSSGGHRFGAVEPRALKGFDEPLQACEVEWAPRVGGPIPFPSRLALGAGSAFVGRQPEHDAITTALDNPTRTVVSIAGEPGIGKTRLAAEIARARHDAGSAILLARCDDGAPELAPIGAMLEGLAEALGPDAVRSRAGDLAFALGGLAPSVGGTTPADDLRLVFEAVDIVLSSLADEQPVIVVLDDLHWADASTLQLVRHVLRSSRAGDLQLLATYRDTELGRTHPLSAFLGDLRRDRLVSRTHVTGLDREEVGALIAGTAGHDAAADFVAAVHGETAGNPFFIGEVLIHLAETGAVERGGDGTWRTTGTIEELGIPEGVREVVGRRLARLSSTANDVLLAAAVAGAEFDLAVVGLAAGTAGDELVRALEEAVAAGVVIELGPGRATFRHALIRQTLLDELSATRRVQLHWRLSDAMEERASDPEDIARHALAGVLAGDAMTAIRRAAAGATALTRRASFESSRAMAEAALAFMAEHDLHDDWVRYDLVTAIADAALNSEGMIAARPHLDVVVGLARRLKEPRRLAEAAMLYGRWFQVTREEALFALYEDALEASRAHGHDLYVAQLLALRATHLQFLGDGQGAVADAAELAALAESTADPAAREAGLRLPVLLQPLIAPIELLEQPAWRGWYEGREAVASRFQLRHALVGPARRGDRARFDRAVAAYSSVAVMNREMLMIWAVDAGNCIARGQFTDAKAAIAGARSRVVESVRASVAFQIIIEEMFRAVRVEEGRTDVLLERVPAFIEAYPGFSHLRPCLASQLAALGREGEALDQLATWRRENEDRLPGSILFGGTIRHLSEAAGLAGDADTCAWLAPMLEPYANELLLYGWGYLFEGSVDRARGQCALTLGELDEAVSLFESAVALEEGFDAPVLAARTRWWLAKALLERGDRTRAAELLDECARFTETVGMRLLHQQATELRAAAN